jgi:hypothetical protein
MRTGTGCSDIELVISDAAGVSSDPFRGGDREAGKHVFSRSRWRLTRGAWRKVIAAGKMAAEKSWRR